MLTSPRSSQSRPPTPQRPDSARRIGWIDAVKGLTILLVVQYHSSVGLEQAIGSSTLAGDFASFMATFRMPLFFLVAGLFLATTLERSWRSYLDAKVLHFAYFYVLWVTIVFIVKAGKISGGDATVWLEHYLFAFVQPHGPLWFIYILAIFFIVTRLLRDVPIVALWVAAGALHVMHLETGSVIVDQFASRYVFFLTGWWLASHVFAWAQLAEQRTLLIVAFAAGFAGLNTLAFANGLETVLWSTLPLGLLGCFAAIGLVAALASKGWAEPLAFFGRHSLVIYLAFFIPMAATRIIGLKLGVIPHELLAWMIPVGAVAGALIIGAVAPRIGLGWLFVRPSLARLSAGQTADMDAVRRATVARGA